MKSRLFTLRTQETGKDTSDARCVHARIYTVSRDLISVSSVSLWFIKTIFTTETQRTRRKRKGREEKKFDRMNKISRIRMEQELRWVLAEAEAPVFWTCTPEREIPAFAGMTA